MLGVDAFPDLLVRDAVAHGSIFSHLELRSGPLCVCGHTKAEIEAVLDGDLEHLRVGAGDVHGLALRGGWLLLAFGGSLLLF